MTDPHVILLNILQIQERELPLAAGKDITPGMFLEFAGTTSNTVQPHSSDSAIPSPVIIANVAPWRLGQGIEDQFDEDGEVIPFHHCQKGDQVYALLAAGEQVDSFADRLQSNGDGTLKIGTTYAFVRPLELVDNSAGYEAVRIKVEVL